MWISRMDSLIFFKLISGKRSIWIFLKHFIGDKESKP